MTLFDDNPNTPELLPGGESSGIPATEEASASGMSLLPGDPLSSVVAMPDAAPVQSLVLPEDLRISWSWVHFLVFCLFILASLATLDLVILSYSMSRNFTQAQFKSFVETNPKWIVGANVLLFALVMLFLYVTLGVLRGLPFWQSLGWRRFTPDALRRKGRPWMYFLAGGGLSIFVAVAGSQVSTKNHLPVEDLFTSRTGAVLSLAMAVLVAPLVEETVFRGYLYPFFAGKFSRFAEIVGIDSARAIRAGSVTGIFVTGILFGLLHGSQLGWTWGLVSLLTLVGVIFTFARAWTGTVLASFLLHLGYNSMIAVTSIIATHGFTHMPHGQ